MMWGFSALFQAMLDYSGPELQLLAKKLLSWTWARYGFSSFPNAFF